MTAAMSAQLSIAGFVLSESRRPEARIRQKRSGCMPPAVRDFGEPRCWDVVGTTRLQHLWAHAA
jgi:hypothetical protein